ncbi:hypothetical protein AT05_08245 [Schleiferia thermophila str. Yellowstone]|nr:hypothetical protein AT05_08245 [Schleiferia thermophila str. Yellowstone]
MPAMHPGPKNGKNLPHAGLLKPHFPHRLMEGSETDFPEKRKIP